MISRSLTLFASICFLWGVLIVKCSSTFPKVYYFKLISFELNNVLLSSAQINIWYNAACRCWGEWLVLSHWHILVSSAKEPRLAFCVFLLMSIISIRNNSRPRTDTWGTTNNTHTLTDKRLFTLTHCCLFLKKASNHLRIFPVMFSALIFCSSIMWSTLSNTFETSS